MAVSYYKDKNSTRGFSKQIFQLMVRENLAQLRIYLTLERAKEKSLRNEKI